MGLAKIRIVTQSHDTLMRWTLQRPPPLVNTTTPAALLAGSTSPSLIIITFAAF
jgi:hypothetical protein